MKTITITHDGFHGTTIVRLRAKNGQLLDIGTGYDFVLSPAQARKLDKAACGSTECRCGESILRQLGWQAYGEYTVPYTDWHLPIDGADITITGYYPQGGN